MAYALGVRQENFGSQIVAAWTPGQPRDGK
jgi:hypothetical protein